MKIVITRQKLQPVYKRLSMQFLLLNSHTKLACYDNKCAMPQVKRSSGHHPPPPFDGGVDQGQQSRILQLQRVPRRVPYQTILMSVPVLRVQNRLLQSRLLQSRLLQSRLPQSRLPPEQIPRPPQQTPPIKTSPATSPAEKTPARSTVEPKGGDGDSDDDIDVEKLFVAMTDGEDNDKKYILFCKFL